MRTLKRTVRLLPRSVLMVVILLWVLVPVYFLVVTSLSPEGDLLDGLELPSSFTLTNYAGLFSGANSIWIPLINSTIVTIASTVIALVLAVPAAYALSHLRHRRSGRMAYLSFFVLRGIPPIALVMPFYLIFAKVQMLNTLPGIIIALAPLALPYCVWTLRVTFDQIPREVEEAGAVDGAGRMRMFFSVVLPIATPGIAATGILAGLFIYVDYIIVAPLAGPQTYTFPIYVTSFSQDFVQLVGPLSAAAIVGAVPMALMFIVSQGFSRRLASAGIH
ncbi:carbohydrate ABC transporter permease [Leifsonia sp. C5G2]|jgi:multiple sugar transport system permease protein|uniref:carbohydrate ABC transporter permease n=1 Tax=Leifsonia sp. C5G2 TaxID=2735269 RepID=UPI001585BD16|nr:carbohydrate ABC transporter permease [Leifsonia sp. C5G2]NUU08450.1 carbohydrate ABC transporter permease [Leifsonia sp. C5G2]